MSAGTFKVFGSVQPQNQPTHSRPAPPFQPLGDLGRVNSGGAYPNFARPDFASVKPPIQSSRTAYATRAISAPNRLPVPAPVAFYTDNPAHDSAACKIGHILCITSGMRHQFVDGSNGYRIEDASTVFVLPCSMSALRALNMRLRAKSAAGEADGCNRCKKPSEERCSRCGTCYCSKECQAADWKLEGHKRECPVIARLRIWNRTDWG
ncbi:hypothetical protein B0H15DRAFT_927216 [Mycena belliarum]|uniref:MYND-type domain-containing protein n=1 Tax=Mycena belliarum TaxID=1033014 RepID=A0AAD6XV06_9AGAR|nr:hypothetical protein B0H15DRAFT_927216 [Mycena belliae]